MTEITIKEQIFKNQKQFEAVLPSNFDVKKFMGTLFLEVQKNPELGKCVNLLDVAKDVASFGLIVGGLANQAYLIPYTNYRTKITTAQLIIGYKGYVAKLEEAGYSIEVELVTKEELDQNRFQEIRGSEPKIIHSPIRTGVRIRENIALAYCILTKDGKQTITVLSKEEIEEIAKTEKWIEENGKKSKTRGLGNVWESNQRTTDYGQMCIKTVIRNCVKKVNLRIANEMSTYEGKRDEQLIDIAPKIETIDSEQGIEIENLCKQKGFDIQKINAAYKINSINYLPADKFATVIKTLNEKPDVVKDEVKDENNN